MPIIISGSNGISGVDGTAAAPAVQGADNNTGMFFPAADQIAFAEGGVEAMRLDASGRVGIGTTTPTSLLTVNGDLSFNSGYGSAAVAYGCRAWVNFNGTGTVAIRASANVSSITDNGTGDYTVNFTAAMPDANYAVGLGSQPDANVQRALQLSNAATPTTSGVRVMAHQAGLGNADVPIAAVAVFR